jgi:polyhydroxyalkanoate synthesis regulator phasin
MFKKLKQKVKEFLLEGHLLYDVPDDFETLTARLDHLEKRVSILEDENIGFINDIYELENIIESLKYNK